jgi:hypothetical protein
MININAKISFHFLIENFTLIIYFRMKCDKQLRFYRQHFTNHISYEKYK